MNKPLDPRVYDLASGLFGHRTVTSGEPPPTRKSTPLPENHLTAVYPAVIQEAYAMTMDNYRLHIGSYNFRTKAENREILKYNIQVDDHRRINAPTSEQSTALIFLERKHGNDFARDYNDRVEEYNARYGPIARKRRIPTVKAPTELVFQNLLSLYNRQLMKRNEQYMRFGVVTRRPLQEIEINSQLVAAMRRNGIRSLDLCKKTIRSHRQRLEEAGVLCCYLFRGAGHAVQMHVNPAILAVLDLKTSKIVSAGNQPIAPTKWKKLPDDDDNTGTIIKEYQMNADAGSPPDKEFAALTPKDLFFYGNTTGKEQNPPMPPAPAGVKILENMPRPAQPQTSAPAGPEPQTSAAAKDEGPPRPAQSKAAAPPASLSDRLADTVLHPQDLAERLAAHEFDSYSWLPIGALSKEAFTGTLTNEEFREVAIQDFFKGAARLWKDSTPYVGSWKIAINAYYADKFIGFRDTALNKSTIIDDIQELRWCVAYARRWFHDNRIPPLFPSDYFDINRKAKSEIGFEYVRTVTYRKHLKALAQQELRKKKAEARAAQRATRVNHAKKCETEVKRFLKNRITMPQLLDYVERNLPPEFMQKLPKILERHLNERRQL